MSAPAMKNVVDAGFDRREQERQAWLAEIGEPAFVHDGFGYWRADWGVMVVERMKNGYHPQYAKRYPTDVIAALARCFELPEPSAAPTVSEEG